MVELSIDCSNIVEFFEGYESACMSLMDRYIGAGVKAAALTIRDNAGLLLLNDNPKSLITSKYWPWSVYQGIMAGKYDQTNIGLKVHTLGHRALPGTHRTRFLNHGTEERYTKKGKYRGKIQPPGNFIERATQMTPWQQIMQKAFDDAITKIGKQAERAMKKKGIKP